MKKEMCNNHRDDGKQKSIYEEGRVMKLGKEIILIVLGDHKVEET